jgi:hypothetical protein
MTTASRVGRLLRPVLSALLLAGAVLVLFVLPAEHGIDPTGAGAALGLTALAGPAGPAARAEPGALRRDEARIVLGPLESVEYSYAAPAGATLVYAFAAGAPLRVDFHGAPATQPETAVSYSRGERAVERGSLQVPFTGEHSFYFENTGDAEVSLTLQVAGFFTTATEYFDQRAYPRETGF